MVAELVMVENALKQSDNYAAKAKEMLAVFNPTVSNKFVVVCDLAFEAAAIRFCQQIQENAKGEAFVSVLPEANHNMIESYYELRDTNYIFLNSGLNERNNLRFAYLKSILEPKGNVIYSFPVSSFNLVSLFEVIHTTDWLSIMVSNAKQADNMRVDIISGLKEYLDKN
jgi:glucose/mannose-6-phosphate isomerase